ncbi:MAG: hypothetical protein ACK4LQ_09400 [Pararhodobacter sp.]
MRPRGPLFLERDTYRRRRVMDGARILPVAGFVAILLPALWARGDGSSMAVEALYLFALWAVLVLAAALLSRPLGSGYKRDAPPVMPPPVVLPPAAPEAVALKPAKPPVRSSGEDEA